jgi:hypothetical protein
LTIDETDKILTNLEAMQFVQGSHNNRNAFCGYPQTQYCKTTAPKVSKVAESNLIRAKNYAEETGITCKAQTCASVRSRLLFKWNLGHEWYMSLNDLHGWNYCVKRLAKARSVAAARGGKLISSDTVSGALVFECSNLHRWVSKECEITKFKWCNICQRAAKKAKKEASSQSNLSASEEQ